MSSEADNFRTPSSAFRGKPFWAWNAKLDAEELKRQMRIFGDMGLGGAFLHARVGLDTPYLSDEWFRIVGECVAEAKKSGLEMWLYDEDRYPSGAAGGIVTKNPEYRAKFIKLTMTRTPSVFKDKKCFAFFDAEFDIESKILKSYKKIPDQHIQLAPNHWLFVFEEKEAEKSGNFNGYTYVDALSKEAIAEFIRVTHKAYAKHFKKDFGKTIPGIFTDEPNFQEITKVGDFAYRMPWTGKLQETFKKQHKYDLIDKLPEVFFQFNNETFSKLRHDLRKTLTYLFTEAFAKQVGKWCEKNNLLFTGHILFETPMTAQCNYTGSNMASLQYFQAPGIDILMAQGLSREGGLEREYLTAKQCASIKNQFGRKWMLSELYGCTGWQFTLAEHKAVGDWQAALGVNLRCHHHAWYSMKGESKRDYPASISYQSPWFREYSMVEDYFARVNMLLSEGKRVADIAVIHPIETVWGEVLPDHMKWLPNAPWFEEKDCDKYLKNLQNILLQEHFDFDYVEEGILAEHGSVSKGKLKVAQASYSSVIVPPMITMRKSTLKYLEELKKSGVPITFTAPVPTLLDCERSEKLEAFIKECGVLTLETDSITSYLKKIPAIHRVSITSNDGQEYSETLYQLRYDNAKKRWILFIPHLTQDEKSGILNIKLKASGNVSEYDCSNGDIYQYKSSQDGEFISFSIELHPCGSKMFVIGADTANAKIQPPEQKEIKTIKLDNARWSISRSEANAFPLDMPEYSFDGSVFEKAPDIIRLDITARTKLGLPRRSGAMIQPWAAAQSNEPLKSTEIILKYTFDVEKIPLAPSYLVLEEPHLYSSITVNGHSLSADDDEGWWIDKSFRKLKVSPALLRCGSNEAVVKMQFSSASNLESLYFIGEFGVKCNDAKFTITELPDELALGDWREQGFPTYSGTINYKNTFCIKKNDKENYVLKFSDWQGSILKIKVNGEYAGRLAWPPFEFDISKWVKDGPNSLEIEVFSTRKNILGPLHHEFKFPQWTGPSEFTCKYTKDYQTIPYGLMDAPLISVRK